MQISTAIMALSIAACAGTCSAQTVFVGSSQDADGLAAVVDDFRDALGEFNAPEPGSVCDGRRQIDWDAAPDGVSAPNEFPGDFFNADFFPRARGLVFSTPGDGFQLSASQDSGVGIEFANIDPSFDELFAVFSPERLFTPIGSTVTIADFKVPGADIGATSTGIGIVFTDVDTDDGASIELHDVHGDSLGVWYAPAGPIENESLSFIGVVYDEPIVASVTIVSGNATLELGKVEEGDVDLVAMDDFIFGEPVNVCAADCDANGELNILDFVCYKGEFDAGSACADVNADGALNIYDFIAFQTSFVAGCEN